MNHSKFSRIYFQMGAEAAVAAALFFGVSMTQVDLWLKTIIKPAYWRG